VAIAAGRSADSEGYHERARLNSKLHKTDAALADFAATIALDPENLALRYERLGALTQAGRLGNASTALGELAHMATTGGTVRGLETEVGAAQNNDDLQGAIGTLTALIGLRPDDDRYYLWRSDLYLWTKQSDKAFADIDTAIRLNPYAMEARHRLGGAYDYVGQPARALSELDTAVTRDPDETAFRRTRGRVNFKLDHPTEAAADFQHAVELEGEPYSIIWLYLTRLKAGTPNLKELRTNMTSYTSRDAEQDPTQHWPYPIMRFLAGDIPESILLAAAEKPDDARRSREQRCEAVFYAGMNARLRGGRSQHGTALLTEARSLCPPGFVEFDVANWELRSAAR
jgi:tetratricopeptide (TPR) repeat protein